MKNLQIGQEFYYAGDMANASNFGKIVGIEEATRYTSYRYIVQMEGDVKTRIVDHYLFDKSIRQTFELIEDYNARREAQMAALYARLNKSHAA